MGEEKEYVTYAIKNDLQSLLNDVKAYIRRGQIRTYYVDHFNTKDEWLWNHLFMGSISNGKLILSNGKVVVSTRFHADRGSLLEMRVLWGITAQSGATRLFGWGHPSGWFFIGFEMIGETVYAIVQCHGERRQVDITSQLPSDYDSAFHSYVIVIDKNVVRFYVNTILVAEIELFALTPHFTTGEGLIIGNYDTIAGDMQVDWVTIVYFTPSEKFTPTSQKVYSGGGDIAGGTSLTTAWSYTVPEGKRAIIEAIQLICDTDSVNEVYGTILLSNGEKSMNIGTVGQAVGISYGKIMFTYPRIELLPGMQVKGMYRNGDTSTHTIWVRALITELE